MSNVIPFARRQSPQSGSFTSGPTCVQPLMRRFIYRGAPDAFFLIGTKEQLIGSGVVEEAAFPKGKKRIGPDGFDYFVYKVVGCQDLYSVNVRLSTPSGVAAAASFSKVEAGSSALRSRCVRAIEELSSIRDEVFVRPVPLARIGDDVSVIGVLDHAIHQAEIALQLGLAAFEHE